MRITDRGNYYYWLAQDQMGITFRGRAEVVYGYEITTASVNDLVAKVGPQLSAGFPFSVICNPRLSHAARGI